MDTIQLLNTLCDRTRAQVDHLFTTQERFDIHLNEAKTRREIENADWVLETTADKIKAVRRHNIRVMDRWGLEGEAPSRFSTFYRMVPAN